MSDPVASRASPPPTPAIVAIGEALWDLFPDSRRPGGAPCNVAYHAAQLGDRGVIVTRVGNDTLGNELAEFLAGRGVDTAYVQRDNDRPTGTVTVTIDRGEPRFAIVEDVAWDRLDASAAAQALCRQADAICVGSLAQRSAASRSAIHRLLAVARDEALVVFDVNLRPPFVDAAIIDATMRRADVVKMNTREVDELAALLSQPHLVDWLVGDVGVETVCLTEGSNGAALTTAAGTVFLPGVETDVSQGDAVGAGDAFTAALAHQLVRHAAAEDCLAAANRYAGLVASKRGAMPPISPAELAAIGL